MAAQRTETARRILEMWLEHRAAITARLGCAAGKGYKVLESLCDRPIVSVRDVESLIGTTHTSANTTVSRLAEIGVLPKMTGHACHRRFRYAPYIALFDSY